MSCNFSVHFRIGFKFYYYTRDGLIKEYRWNFKKFRLVAVTRS